MKSIARLPVLMVLTVGFSAIASADTIWNVSASFAYNSFANAAPDSFTFDPNLNLVTWNIIIFGTHTQTDNTYTPINSIAVYPDGRHIDFFDAGTAQYVDFYLTSPVTNAGGTITLRYGDESTSGSSTVVCPGCSTLIAGLVSTLSIPEPGSIALFGSGMAAMLRRRLVL